MSIAPSAPRWCFPLSVVACLVGLGLLVHGAWQSSATYDEVAYIRVAAHWWRTGDQTRITRMGSPLTFWKVQQAPVLWLIDRAGYGAWIDDPTQFLPDLLPWLRVGGLWIWALGLGITGWWARRLAGPIAMTLASWLYALSPNLIAHGGLVTMEQPLTTAWVGVCYLFWEFLAQKDFKFFIASALLTGLTFSLKFTAILLPPLLGLAWVVQQFRLRTSSREFVRQTIQSIGLMVVFVSLMVMANLVVTGFAMLPPSERTNNHPSLGASSGAFSARWIGRLIETPMPQDWVGFAIQLRHQRSGGPSFLMGERRMHGWWYYYFVAMAVKVPLWFWLLVAARFLCGRKVSLHKHASLPLVVIVGFLTITALGSSRNYGVRYLLPLAPLAIVWVSQIVEAGRAFRLLAGVVAVGYAGAIATTHPHELTYFPAWVGGKTQGKTWLADSNFDWGQGARSLARLQRQQPELRRLTLYILGETDPQPFGVVGIVHVVDAGEDQAQIPEKLQAETPFLAVSASLEVGLWGPPGYFALLRGIKPVAITDDGTISVYRTTDLAALPN